MYQHWILYVDLILFLKWRAGSNNNKHHTKDEHIIHTSIIHSFIFIVFLDSRR